MRGALRFRLGLLLTTNGPGRPRRQNGIPDPDYSHNHCNLRVRARVSDKYGSVNRPRAGLFGDRTRLRFGLWRRGVALAARVQPGSPAAAATIVVNPNQIRRVGVGWT